MIITLFFISQLMVDYEEKKGDKMKVNSDIFNPNFQQGTINDAEKKTAMSQVHFLYFLTFSLHHNTGAEGPNVVQLVEHWTPEVEVRGSKPALGTGGGVGSRLTSPIRWDARSWMAKSLETDNDNRQLTTARFWIAKPWK